MTYAEHAPYVNVQPISRTVNVGSSVNFGIPINGSGPLHIQWRFARTTAITGGPSWQTIAGATNEDFIISPVTLGNVGSYSVIATNIFGSLTSSTVTLTVRQVDAWGDNTYNKTNVPATSPMPSPFRWQ